MILTLFYYYRHYAILVTLFHSLQNLLTSLSIPCKTDATATINTTIPPFTNAIAKVIHSVTFTNADGTATTSISIETAN